MGAKKTAARAPTKRSGKRRPAQARVEQLNPSASAPWSVSPEQLSLLDETGLPDLMRELFAAEAYRTGASVNEILPNASSKAADDGCDAMTPAASRPSAWFSSSPTCWQMKAGNAGTPSKLGNEVRKKIPADVLRKGGRFVLVASGSTSGAKGLAARLSVLKDDARAARLPVSQITVLTSESLATWVNEYPAIAARLRRIPGTFCTLAKWMEDPQHQETWTATALSKAQLEQICRELAPLADGPSHLHVYGRPGVGKTRLVLEACKAAPWANVVLYVPQVADSRVAEILHAAASAPATTLVLVVDEVPGDKVRHLAFAAKISSGRVRVISIGPDKSPDLETVAEVEVRPLDNTTMETVVRGWHQSMPFEHVRYVTALADGFVRFARMAARAVLADPTIDTASLFGRGELKQLMESMLGNVEERQPLYVLAILASVGWTGARAVEGEAIAKHFGLSWTSVQASVQMFDRLSGIAPRAGDLRYISPAPLGVYLALEALEAYPDRVRSLRAQLPTDDARRAFDERYRSVVASPQAKEAAQEELAFFFEHERLSDSLAVERWRALSGAHPARAAAGIRRLLDGMGAADVRKISGGARRHLVGGLVALAARSDAFDDSARALASLALGENETWANNAAGEFAGLFQLNLAGTEVPYVERLHIVDELLARETSDASALAASALSRVGATSEMRLAGDAPMHAPAATPWWPRSLEEKVSAIRESLARLTTLAARPGLNDALIHAVQSFVLYLRDGLVREQVAAFLRTTVKNHDDLREVVRREVFRIVKGERKYWKKLGEADVQWLERLHSEFEDRSEVGQIRQALTEMDQDRRAELLRPFADRYVEDPGALVSVWPLLTGGTIGAVWDFGLTLAKADPQRRLLRRMLTATERGDDLRIISAYLHECSTTEAAGWIDDWLDSYEGGHRDDALLLFDVTWRCASTSRGARRFLRMARDGRLTPSMVGHLGVGAWPLGPDVDDLTALLKVLNADPRNRECVLALLEHRISKRPEDLEHLESLVLELLSDVELVRGDTMTAFYWQELATRVVKTNPGRIAKVIFAAQAEQDQRRAWFVQHSQASGVLFEAAKADPSSVWAALAPHLAEPRKAMLFAVGFAPGLLNQLPHEDILQWVAQEPTHRANVIARMSAKAFHDGSLAAGVLERFGDVPGVGNTFRAAFSSGSWTGSASNHWHQLATQLESVARDSSHPGVKRWAQRSVSQLREMAQRDQKREAEEELRGR